MDIARHVMKRIFCSRFLSELASHDVASTTHQSLYPRVAPAPAVAGAVGSVSAVTSAASRVVITPAIVVPAAPTPPGAAAAKAEPACPAATPKPAVAPAAKRAGLLTHQPRAYTHPLSVSHEDLCGIRCLM